MEPNNRQDFRKLLLKTIARVNGLKTEAEELPPLEAIGNQLNYLEDWTAHGRIPTPFERERLNFNLIALREFSHLEELCESLTTLGYYAQKKIHLENFQGMVIQENL